MKQKDSLVLLCVMGIFIFGVFGIRNIQAEENDFPLAPGTYWVYEGLVKWQVESGVKERQMTWKMEVIKKVERGEFTGYLMKGHPIDLVFYEDGRISSDYAIIRNGEKFYETDVETFQRLKDLQDKLENLVSDAELTLDLPLMPGKKFGEAEMLDREDDSYCWMVKEARPFSRQINGVALSDTLTEYLLTFATLPEDVVVHFTPGIGITRFEYVHHGTISEVDVSLIEYHASSSQ
ncbi:hypothetical protein U27_04759 [Candidatus Vecturithrix granuli]|uniref:DUF3108 domain-containing protein n=1 Tax=Vecturithrix granuli TaxID=1499967 RepID=A0A081BZN7_VECG1|nr:hypothetical protein U27_04759 [Candidatus Vecturithrix granuli]